MILGGRLIAALAPILRTTILRVFGEKIKSGAKNTLLWGWTVPGRPGAGRGGQYPWRVRILCLELGVCTLIQR